MQRQRRGPGRLVCRAVVTVAAGLALLLALLQQQCSGFVLPVRRQHQALVSRASAAAAARPQPSSLILRRPATTVEPPSSSSPSFKDADPLKFSGDEQEAVFSFERRLGDAGVVAPGLEHALFWPEGDFAPSRGLRAKQDTSPGQVLVELPRGQAICLDEGEGTPFPQWVPQKQWKKLPWYAQLGLKLVYERKVATSPLKASYAQLLPPPGALPTPFHWADADLEALRAAYPALAQRVDRQRQAWEELYDGLGKTRAVREDMDEATFVWAMESVLSRSFKGTFGTGLRSLGPSLLLMGLFAAVYKVDQETIQLVTYALEEYPFLAALPAALTLLPLLLEFVRSKGTYVLAPMIDSLNHKSTVATDLDYDSLRSRFRLRLGQKYRAGEQVFMSYGAKSNDDLVMYYGFVEPDAAADVFEFGDLLAWLQQNRGGVVNDDRLQTMYSKGLQDAVRSCKIARGGRVADEKALEGLRVLLASDEELRAENAITESIIQTPMFLTMDEFEDSVFAKELESPTELAVYEALLEACQEQRARVALTDADEEELRAAASASASSGAGEKRAVAASSPSSARGAAAGSTQARLLTLAFRKEKVRVLNEAIARFARLTGKGVGSSGSSAAASPS